MKKKGKLPENYKGLEMLVKESVSVNQGGKEEVCKQIGELLYGQLNISTEQVESRYYPFGQAGYLSVRQKFEIMLYLAAKEAPGSGRKQLFQRAGWNGENITNVSGNEVEEQYLRFWEEGWITLQEIDKKVLLIKRIYEIFGYGILESLMEQETEGLFAGVLFWDAFRQRRVSEKPEDGVGVLEKGSIVRLEFLSFPSKEELCRITRRLVCMGGRGELTAASSEWSIVCADGTRARAVCPPKFQGWGIELRKDNAGRI
ncbi:MAG: hypothetical protein ACI4FZ_10495 [Lachnospiraceae bacterium]